MDQRPDPLAEEDHAHCEENVRRVDELYRPLVDLWIGRLIVSLMSCFIAFQWHAAVTLGVAWYDRSPEVTWLLRACFVVAMSNVYLDYARTCLTCPGRPAVLSHAGAGVAASGVAKAKGPWCQTCDAPKPERAHHCSSCGKCTLRMDHHCIFTNCCIGERNYRYFMHFVWSLVVGLTCTVLVELPQAVELVVCNATFFMTLVVSPKRLKHIVESYFGFDMHRSLNNMPPGLEQVHILVACISGIVALFLLCMLWSSHMNQVLINTTTLEEYRRQGEVSFMTFDKRPEHDRGSLVNVSEVFGAPPAWCRRPVAIYLNSLRYWFADMLDDTPAADDEPPRTSSKKTRH